MSDNGPQPQAPPSLNRTPPRWVWLIIGWLGTAAILGIPYFTIPVKQVEQTTALWLGGLVVIGAMAATVRVVGQTRAWQAVGAPLGGFLTVVASRIAADVAVDPTSHNLWPFELAVLVAAGGAAALVGAFIGSQIAHSLRR